MEGNNEFGSDGLYNTKNKLFGEKIIDVGKLINGFINYVMNKKI